MKHLVEKIANKEYDSAKDIFESRMFDLVEKKLLEAKKSTGAKMMEQPMGQIGPTVPEKRKTGVIEADVSSGKMLKSPKEDKLSNWIKNNAAQYAGSSAISSLASKVASHVHPGMTNPIGIAADIILNPTTANAGEEEQLKKMRDGEKTVAMKEAYGKGYVSPAKKIEDAMKKRGIDPNSSDKYRKEMERLNAQYEKLKAKDKKLDEEDSDRLKSLYDFSKNFGGKEISSPLVGTKYGSPTRSGSQGFEKFKSDLDLKDVKPGEASYNKNKPETGGEASKELSKSDSVYDRIKKGAQAAGQGLLDFSDKSNKIIGNLNDLIRKKISQYTTEEVELDEEELDEARVKIVKARIRGGKIQRRKRVSNVPGMTIRSGKLIRMSPAERRRRRLGQKRGKIKRRAKLSRTLMKRQRSLRKRKSLGL